MHIRHSVAHPDTRFILGSSDVHFWRVDLKAAAGEENQSLAVLSDDEQARASRFHFQVDRRYFIAARAMLRKVLAGYLAVDPGKLTFIYSPKNKPGLGGAHANDGLSFNISHSGDIALIGCTRDRRIGVDVELIRNDFDTAAIAARFFSAAEQNQLAALPPEHRHEAFFRCWTRKEAYIKATGEGLSLPLDQFDVSLAPHDQNALLATRPDELESNQWSLRDLVVAPGYAAALCVSGTNWNLVDMTGR
jgi:4'-phosphopantetheinyl transferase